MSFYKILFLGLTTIISGCAKQSGAVARTAATGDPPWTCSEGGTEVQDIGDGKYRLIGCGENVVYQCNMSIPRCWR